VGPATARKLHARGLTRVEHVARLEEAALVAMLGRAAGRQLHALARARDPRRVRPGRRRRSVGAQRALGRGAHTAGAVDTTLVGLVDRVTGRMRKARRVGRTVVLRLRFDDFTRSTRSTTLRHATAETHVILVAARGLLAAAWPEAARRGLTLVGVTVANVSDDAAVQLALPLDPQDGGAVDEAVDEIRRRFGRDAVTRGVLLGRDPGLLVPLPPD
jgi:DNA polymerase-4